jgi:hypothetical protein
VYLISFTVHTLKGMGVKDWKRLALERDKWKKIVEEVKA